MRLIEAIRPDVLFKGADYTVDTVVGDTRQVLWLLLGATLCVLVIGCDRNPASGGSRTGLVHRRPRGAP